MHKERKERERERLKRLKALLFIITVNTVSQLLSLKPFYSKFILRKESSGDGQSFRDFSQKQLAVC
jgi:hypothetical protein